MEMISVMTVRMLRNPLNRDTSRTGDSCSLQAWKIGAVVA